MKTFIALLACHFSTISLAVPNPSTSLKHLTARERAYLNAIKAVYNLTIFPNNDCVIENSLALPVSIFHPNVRARVFDFAIHLTSPPDTAEYLYKLTPNSHTDETLSSVIVGVEFNYFVVQDRTAYTSSISRTKSVRPL